MARLASLVRTWCRWGGSRPAGFLPVTSPQVWSEITEGPSDKSPRVWWR